MELADKCVVITGASRGIGGARALACSREGAVVGFNYFRAQEQSEMLRLQDEVLIRLLRFDVSDETAVSASVGAFTIEQGML